MKRLRIGVIDVVSRGPTRALYARVMNANLAGIMPQAIAAWCKQDGHEVSYVCYTGFEDLLAELPPQVDIVFLATFTEVAHTAYALGNLFRSRGAVTVIGGPHARCYPEDSAKYFDYVLGFTDRETIREVLRDCSQHRPVGAQLSARRQPTAIPGVRERFEFIEATLRKAPLIQIVPMLGSLGCPYTCSFCIDASVPYQPLDFDVLREDLKFLLQKYRRPIVGWHDPNFGVRFDDYLDMIEGSVPPGRMRFAAEMSLSLLSEPHLKRLAHNGFGAILPGIESWYDLGNKSKTGSRQGIEKVRHVSEHVNLILKYIPYVQTNFVLGLDSDEGSEPFELTKRFLDWTPGAFPSYSLLTAFGRATPLNLDYQRAHRVLSFPFHLLNNSRAMNVSPKNYAWSEFYRYVVDLTSYSFSPRAIARRFRANRGMIPKWMNVLRAVSSEGWGRVRFHRDILRRLGEDASLRRYFDRESDDLPVFYIEMLRRELGVLWDWLPEGALHHDPDAYLHHESRGAMSVGS